MNFIFDLPLGNSPINSILILQRATGYCWLPTFVWIVAVWMQIFDIFTLSCEPHSILSHISPLISLLQGIFC